MEYPSTGRRIWTGALSLSMWLSACGGEAGEVQMLPPGAPIALSEVPILTVGERADDPTHEFDRVVTPFLFLNGVGVPLSGEGTIRIFDSDGDLVRTLGASGEGPGEFTRLSSAWARGDTVEAFDGALNRITRFVPGQSAETILLEGVSSAQVAVPGLADGSWVLYGVKKVQRDGRDLIAVHRFAPDGRHLGQLCETFGFRRHSYPGGTGPDPISPRPLVRTEGQKVLVAETLTPHITELDGLTGATRSVEWTPRRVMGAGEAAQVARAAVTEPDVPEGTQSRTLASFDALTGNEDVSVFWDFLVDEKGFFWIRDYDPSTHSASLGGLGSTGSGGEWSVLDRDGQYVTTITVPKDFEPLAIESHQLIGIRRDEFDVESVRVYKIARSGES